MMGICVLADEALTLLVVCVSGFFLKGCYRGLATASQYARGRRKRVPVINILGRSTVQREWKTYLEGREKRKRKGSVEGIECGEVKSGGDAVAKIAVRRG